MQITNRHNLPDPFVSAVKRKTYRKVGNISVSGLIAPPRKRVLEERHDAEIVVDVVDQLWSFWGTVCHKALEQANTDNHLAEERLTTNIAGWTVSGQPDLLDSSGTVTDWKFVSAFSFLLGLKPEWKYQISAYAWLYRIHGFDVKRGQVVAIIRDFDRRKTLTGFKYPSAPVQVIPVELLSQSETQEWVEMRVNAHKAAEALPDDQLPHCTPAERWEKPTTWAVIPKGKTKAARGGIFETEQQAFEFSSKYGPSEIQHRPGSPVRCVSFCHAAPFCNQFNSVPNAD